MPIDSIGYPIAGYGADSVGDAKTRSEKNGDLSMNDFFTLLAAQMQNQSMYDSVDTSQYMTQLAQYTQLAQLQQLNASTSTSYAVSLIGKEISLATTDAVGNELLVSGKVEEVAFQDGTPYMRVGDTFYKTSEVLSVKNAKEGGE